MTTPSNDLFEVYHYCTPEDKAAGRKTPNGFYLTMAEAEQWLARFNRLAKVRGRDTEHYIQMWDLENLALFLNEYP